MMNRSITWLFSLLLLLPLSASAQNRALIPGRKIPPITKQFPTKKEHSATPPTAPAEQERERPSIPNEQPDPFTSTAPSLPNSPIEPTSSSIARDLEGRSFSEQTQDGYYRNIDWTIRRDHACQVFISDMRDQGNERYYTVTLTLTEPSGARYFVEGEACYLLKNNRWTFEYFSCDRIMPEITGRYNQFIEFSFRGFTRNDLYATNKSDLTLQVGGMHYNTCSGQWCYFLVVIPPLEEAQIYYYVDDYRIHFIERR